MRTRFAPSPTGMFHIGGLRTALYAWLVAKQSGGKFLLRIEDTDQAREVQGSVEAHLNGLEWAGIAPDEGVVMEHGKVAQRGDKGPYFQSERLETYRTYLDILIEKGHAYPCFCTPERLEKMRNDQQAKKQAPMYDRTCCKLTTEEAAERIKSGEKHVFRMKVPHNETITFNDDIRGEVSFKGHTIDDQVLLKGDGFPTYHLAHVIDDHFMDIGIVIRGEEWLSSLPKHVLLFDWFGWTKPRYAHLPLILNEDKTKLSKRQGAVSVHEFVEKGYLPETIVNFIALLGWNPGTTQELFSLDELKEAFSLERVQKAGAVFDANKLDWLQGQWIRKIPTKEFADRILPIVAEKHPAANADKDFEQKAALIHERITFFHEAPDMVGFFYDTPHVSKELMASAKQKVAMEDLPTILATLDDLLEAIPAEEWAAERILNDVKASLEKNGYKLGQLLWPLRALLTGREYSPGAVEVAEVLGKKETMKRLKAVQ